MLVAMYLFWLTSNHFTYVILLNKMESNRGDEVEYMVQLQYSVSKAMSASLTVFLIRPSHNIKD